MRANERSLQLAERQCKANERCLLNVFTCCFFLSLGMGLWPFCSLFPMEFHPTHTNTYFFYCLCKKSLPTKIFLQLLNWHRQMNAVWLGWHSTFRDISKWASPQHAMSTNLNQFYSSIFNWIYGIRFGRPYEWISSIGNTRSQCGHANVCPMSMNSSNCVMLNPKWNDNRKIFDTLSFAYIDKMQME